MGGDICTEMVWQIVTKLYVGGLDYIRDTFVANSA